MRTNVKDLADGTRGASNRFRLSVLGVLAVAGSAMAAPPAVGALELPVDLASIVTVALAAVGAMLVILVGPTLGLAAVKGLINWARKLSSGRASA